MSRPAKPDAPLPSRSPLKSHGGRRRPPTRLASLGTSNQRLSGPPSGLHNRRASVSGLTAAPKAQRTSKTTQKLVVLPSAPQTRPLVPSDEEDLTLGYVTDGGIREYKSEAERMTKEQRKQAGFRRLTAYCVAESFNMKLLASFLKREHNVAPRVFDEALYAMYHLPLLPGYGPNANIRSSAPAPVTQGASYMTALSEAEEDGYQGSYFTQPIRRSSVDMRDGPSSSVAVLLSDTEAWTDSESIPTQRRAIQVREPHPAVTPPPPKEPTTSTPPEDEIAEVVFFEYGVVVFFGLTERQENDILEDIENAGIMKRKISEDDWEIEEFHFTHDPYISYPRIYNDFFTFLDFPRLTSPQAFKSRSHLLKLSIAHALAQSTLLAHYEEIAQRVLLSPQTLSIPRQLVTSGSLHLRRHEALKLTGKLFKLRRDVNLVSNVLDVPELFWSEASLKDLYDAVREYMEIGGRVQSLNEKLGVASDFLDAIHDHLNNSAMERITWIVIWLIVVAILVELGEVIARLIVHATLGNESNHKANFTAAAIQSLAARVSNTGTSSNIQVPIQVPPMSKEEVLRTLERLMAD
ncbi:Sporulation protein RMD8 [Leucoagaricus sp. SymC.cos]|nr:Sporulation protein RMD8 [Leucoagaricus sp. SymC.cos]